MISDLWEWSETKCEVDKLQHNVLLSAQDSRDDEDREMCNGGQTHQQAGKNCEAEEMTENWKRSQWSKSIYIRFWHPCDEIPEAPADTTRLTAFSYELSP